MGDYQKVWREFERNEVTHSAAHYLLAVAAFGKSGRDPRAVVAVARRSARAEVIQAGRSRSPAAQGKLHLR